ncbi:hypothetical protein [Brevundimonas diminuta]|uniref:hypothetical protein n=1 Tax=Brevundimonas diminuta TaxID=293 RepID=UPI001F59C3E9|nr:hypothetical protein [Brevundimonas diminuta]
MAAPRPRHPAGPDMEGIKEFLQQDARGRTAAQDQLFRRSGVLFWRLVRGVDQRARRDGFRGRTQAHDICDGGVDRRQFVADDQVLVGAAMVVVRFDRLPVEVAVIRVDKRIAGAGVDGLMIVIVIIGRDFHIGDAGELNRVLDLMLGADRAKGLQRDHKGHGNSDAKLASKVRQ